MLSKREFDVPEFMDDPQCDRKKLIRTYLYFRYINAMFARWPYIYRRYMRPLMNPPPAINTILDIGFGGGDVAAGMVRLAGKDGVKLHVFAIDSNAGALEAVTSRKWPENIEFHQMSLEELDPHQRQFDFVISNHLLHHFSESETPGLLERSARLARCRVIFGDLVRSAYAYYSFATLKYFFRDSYIVPDGLASIRRAYSVSELRSICPPGWEVHPIFPSRMILIGSPDRSGIRA